MTTDATDTGAPVEGAETAIPPVDLPSFWSPLDSALLSATKLFVVAVGVAFIVLVTLEVASRFLFGQSVSMVNGTSRFLLVWFFMIGAGLALRQGAHVALDILGKRLPPLPATILYFVAQMLTLTFLLQLLWGGYVALNASFSQVEGSLGVSLAWVMAAFPVGFGLLIYHQMVLVTGAVRKLTGKATKP